MPTPRHPPRDLTAAAFFATWLPEEYARLRAEGAPVPPDVTVAISLDGDGGGAWTVALRGGALSVAPGASAADLRITQSVADFRALMIGEDGAPEIFPRDLDLVSALAKGGDAAVTMARGIRGTLAISVTGFAGRIWTIAVAFQDAATPNATVTVDADTALAMRAGTLSPPEAFFGGKLQLGGDVAWIMQLAMGAMAKGTGGASN